MVKDSAQKVYKGAFFDYTIPEDREIIDCDSKRFRWKEDKNGYFLIRVDGDVLRCGFVVDHVMVKEFRGKHPGNILKEVARQELVNLEHMGYLGAELARAKICMDTGTPYEQQ